MTLSNETFEQRRPGVSALTRTEITIGAALRESFQCSIRTKSGTEFSIANLAFRLMRNTREARSGSQFASGSCSETIITASIARARLRTFTTRDIASTISTATLSSDSFLSAPDVTTNLNSMGATKTPCVKQIANDRTSIFCGCVTPFIGMMKHFVPMDIGRGSSMTEGRKVVRHPFTEGVRRIRRIRRAFLPLVVR